MGGAHQLQQHGRQDGQQNQQLQQHGRQDGQQNQSVQNTVQEIKQQYV